MGLAQRKHMFPPALISLHTGPAVPHLEPASQPRGCTGLDRRAARSQGDGTVAVPFGTVMERGAA
jgi:hypothetical protein